MLGHTRLSIIDLSVGGHQPMSTPDGRLLLTYNGEIYNYLELRRELEDQYEFQSESDTEVLLAAWRAWGPACVERLVGMFAFCVVDTAKSTAWLVRDHFGIKPLYYVLHGSSLTFASEIRPLVDAGITSRRIAAGPLYDYLHGGNVDHADETMIEGLRRLPAGTLATVRLDAPEERPVLRRYWRVGTDRHERPFDEVVADLAERFRHSVDLHLRSDVPVGTALSGGIDSSAIICTMRSLLGPEAEIHAFSFLAGDRRFDEEQWIDLVGAASGATVHKVRVDPAELPDEMDDLVRSQGEPFANMSIVAQRRVFEAARLAGVPVLLDGQGADELFGGYRRYLAGQLAGLVRSGHLVAAGRLAVGVARLPDVRLTRREVARTLGGALPAKLGRRLLDAAGLRAFPPWLDEDWFRSQGIGPGSASGPSSLDDALADAFTSTTLPSLLRYEDRNSMRYSVESRVPFLERELVEMVFAAPRSALVGPDGLTKAAFRAAMRGTVPAAVLDRRDKIGFTPPADTWLRQLGPWVEGVLGSDAVARIPGLVPPACLDEWRAVRDGRAHFDSRVWRWVNAARWAELMDLSA